LNEKQNIKKHYLRQIFSKTVILTKGES